jgi:GTPase SAR1 family protein
MCHKCNRPVEAPCGDPECNLKGISATSFKGDTFYCCIAGITGSGKTCYLTVLLKKLLEENYSHFDRDISLQFSLPNKNERERLDRFWNNINQGELGGTPNKAPEPYNLLVNIIRKGRHTKSVSICLYNIAGEKFRTQLNASEATIHHDIRDAHCCIFMIDPSQDIDLRRALYEETKSKGEDYNLLPSLIGLWGRERSRPKVGIPIAICINKYDLVEDILYPKYLPHPNPSSEKSKKDIELFLNNKTSRYQNLSNSIKTLSYFAVAPLGYELGASHGEVKTTGVVEPFFWLLSKFID